MDANGSALLAGNGSLLMDEYGDAGNVTEEDGADGAEAKVENKVLFVVIFVIFCLIGIVGNGSLMLLVMRFPNLRTMPNILMVNLTFGDLLYIVATLPNIIRSELSIDRQPATEALCKFEQFLPGFGAGVCVYSMTALSVERYCAIVRGLEMRSMRTSRRVAGAMVFIWGMTFLVSSPILFSAGFLYPEFPGLCARMIIGPSSVAYARIHLSLKDTLPLLTMGFCYARIALQLTKGARESTPNSRSSTNYEARRRLAVAMIVMAIFFGVFWLPTNVFKLYFEVNFDRIYLFTGTPLRVYHFFRRFSRVFAYTNSCLNPWILYFISTTHRRAIARCLCCCAKDSQGEGGYRMVRMRTNGRTVTTFHSYASESSRNSRTVVKPEDI